MSLRICVSNKLGKCRRVLSIEDWVSSLMRALEFPWCSGGYLIVITKKSSRNRANGEFLTIEGVVRNAAFFSSAFEIKMEKTNGRPKATVW